MPFHMAYPLKCRYQKKKERKQNDLDRVFEKNVILVRGMEKKNSLAVEQI